MAATTTTTTEQPVLTPWVRYYRTLAQEPGPYHDLDERDLSYLDNMSSGYLENESRFMLDITNSDGINFILLPEGRGYVRLFHQCITHRANLPGRDPVVVGLFGSRATSPFRQIQTAAAVMKMNVPATRTATEGWIPGPEAFLGVETATDFSSLTGHAGAEDEPGQVDSRQLEACRQAPRERCDPWLLVPNRGDGCPQGQARHGTAMWGY